MIYYFIRLIIGCLYPIYLSYKALKHKDENECTRLITYWIVFSMFSVAEGFLDIFIGFWLPFYYESKMIFLFWLISPYLNGASILYENFINKKLDQHEEVIDECIMNAKQFSISAFWMLWDRVHLQFKRLLLKIFAKAQMATIQYVHTQYNNPPFNNFRLNLHQSLIQSTAPKYDHDDSFYYQNKPDPIPMITEQMDTDTNSESIGTTINNDEESDAKEMISEKKQVRKTKRKQAKKILNPPQTLTIEDISTFSLLTTGANRPITRSITAAQTIPKSLIDFSDENII